MTLNVETAVDVSFPKFFTINLLVETWPGLISIFIFSTLKSQNKPFATLVSNLVVIL